MEEVTANLREAIEGGLSVETPEVDVKASNQTLPPTAARRGVVEIGMAFKCQGAAAIPLGGCG